MKRTTEAAFRVLQEGCHQMRKRIEAGGTGLLPGYADRAVVLSRFADKDDALRILHPVWTRTRNIDATEPELVVVSGLFYRHAEEGD